MMKIRSLCLCLALAAAVAASWAAGGLVAPASEAAWSGWHARITVQTEALAPLSLSRLADSSSGLRRLQGLALLGDYHFAQPWFGTFRATSGLVIGTQSGVPQFTSAAGQRLGLVVNSSGLPAPLGGGGIEGSSAVPYLGLGFSGLAGHSRLSISADFGLVAENSANAGGAGRALLGNQGTERALRELRLSPLLQIGVRYTF